MTNLLSVLGPDLEASQIRPLFVHAHPDDETLVTGQLMAWCIAQGMDVSVVTCTRGEQGEVVPGSIPASTSLSLTDIRMAELFRAIDAFGVTTHYYLGEGNARASGKPARVYEDSGMTWVTETVAGPHPDSGPNTLVKSDLGEEIADLTHLINHLQPTVVISYDPDGTYGHPDHVRVYEMTNQATKDTGVRFVQATPAKVDGFTYFQLADQAEKVREAAACYETQLTLDGPELVLSGGQRRPLHLMVGVR